jgi:ankyrin repeat protein
MDPTGSLEVLQNFLDTGGDVNYSLPALFGTESRTLLQTAASTGTSDMVALLLKRGASLKHLTDDNKSVVDLACDAEKWDSFELLKNAADDRFPHVLPKPRRLDHRRDFFPSEFFFKLRNPFGDYYKNLRLVSPTAAEDKIEDMVQRTRKLKIANDLSDMVPYPEENAHLICKSTLISLNLSSSNSDNLGKYLTRIP